MQQQHRHQEHGRAPGPRTATRIASAVARRCAGDIRAAKARRHVLAPCCGVDWSVAPSSPAFGDRGRGRTRGRSRIRRRACRRRRIGAAARCRRRRCGRGGGAGGAAAAGPLAAARRRRRDGGAAWRRDACGRRRRTAPALRRAAGVAFGRGIGGHERRSAAGGGSGFSCAPRSKISPGPGWILVVGERGAACANSFDSSSSCTSRPAFADSPRSTTSRCASLPLRDALHLELRQPRVVGKHLRHVLDDAAPRPDMRTCARARSCSRRPVASSCARSDSDTAACSRRLRGEPVQARSRIRASATPAARLRQARSRRATRSAARTASASRIACRCAFRGGSRLSSELASAGGGSPASTATTFAPHACACATAASTCARRAVASSTRICAARRIAFDHLRVEVQLVGLERRVPIEIVGERLSQILLEGGGQHERLRRMVRGASATATFTGAARCGSRASALRPSDDTVPASPPSATRAISTNSMRPSLPCACQTDA